MTAGTDARPPGTPEASETAETVVTPRAETTPAAPVTPPSTPPTERKKGPGLGTKFFLAAALLVAATLAAAIAIATWRANQEAEASIKEGLREIPNVFRSYLSSLANDLTGAVASAADELGTRQLFDLPATPEAAQTILDWTDDKAAKLGARTVFLFDVGGVLIGRSGTLVTEGERRSFAEVKWVAGPLRMAAASAVIREGTALSLVAAVPVVAGDVSRGEGRLLGVVAAAEALDEGRAEALKGITNGQTAFVADTAKRGEKPKIELAASTSGFRGEALLPALARDGAAIDALFTQGREVGPLDLDAGGERRIVAAVPVKSASGETLGAFVVSRSRVEETAAFRRIRDTLLLIGAASILLALPVSFLLGRRIARPLGQLARGAEAIREGNLDVRLPEGGSDEVGALAGAFSAMVGELKEKAALEAMIAGLPQRRAGDRPVSDETRAAAPPEPSRPGAGPRVGQIFANRYVVLSILGKGGMGRVYRALDRELDDEIALKVLTPDACGEAVLAVPALRQEIRLARKITHPNVVRTHDLGEVDGLRFLTMEYVPGTTLREVIDRRGALALGPGLQIAKQLCRGLGAVHEAGIIHRDIKPPNIMVLPNGVVKLMDFGIARPTEGIDPTGEAGHTVGTPYYMSPEQVRGLALDARSDIYAVGVVLYELFTGTRPIEGRDPLEVMRGHATVVPTPPSALRPDLPDLLDRLVVACLAKSPDRRPPSANDVYGALMRLQA